ncbi:hypothetical protein LCGC14_2025080 [marine sediment metagenome]|uniref:Uncharacterized protein n=1 Tax=marine sediment metagenome TaxID=412755 RepID=A0A0F9EWD5_9ZZZZ
MSLMIFLIIWIIGMPISYIGCHRLLSWIYKNNNNEPFGSRDRKICFIMTLTASWFALCSLVLVAIIYNWESIKIFRPKFFKIWKKIEKQLKKLEKEDR